MATIQPVLSGHLRTQHERWFAQGLRPIQIWVPDVDAPGFRSEAHRQSQAVADSAHAHEDQDFIDAVSVLDFGSDGA